MLVVMAGDVLKETDDTVFLVPDTLQLVENVS
jgi:hypothetical protein